MFKISQKGDLKKTFHFLEKASKLDMQKILGKYGEDGVRVLSSATPVNTGKTANSWTYRIETSNGSTVIYWNNTNVVNGVSIALILNYGHGTRNGGYVQGRYYINPAIRPLFDKMADAAWKEVITS